MAGYIGKVQINSNSAVLVGSTLYGICSTSASVADKVIGATDDPAGKFINTNYDNLIQGSTIHVKFVNGNDVTSGVRLAVGTTTATAVVGNCTCPANTVISFTLDENQQWVTNDNVDTNTEYEFMTAYNATSNKVATASDLDDLNIQDAAHKDVITDIGANSTSTDLPTAQAVAQYVQAQTGGLGGLTGAMHFRGTSTVAITDGSTVNPTISGYDFHGNGDNSGDVVLYNAQEYVWTGSSWELLGDEGSYALKSSTATIVGVASTTFTANTLPQLSTTVTTVSSVSITNGTAPDLVTASVSVPNVTQAGEATTASVNAGILNITIGRNTVLGTNITFDAVSSFTAGSTPQIVTSTPVSITGVTNWEQGSAASFNMSTTSTIVVVPNAPAP